MKSFHKTIILVSVLAVFTTLTGCASRATPNFYNGGYYMAGDENCARISVRTSNTINCFKADSTITGYRNVMTQQQLDMYMHNKRMSQASNDNGSSNAIRDLTNTIKKAESDALTRRIMNGGTY